ncbi:sulfatase-like hydrolase/transferase [Gelidibacter salicanalis]|uniref:Sulfatase-like hydrolase/transferase n=1 Tax=Gelidibacter salicanalis TaxID=291193 RepID=A0A934KYD8_9FLAO|nr:sulfatase-like hydrolase/transferase [Gelidibacter salicanalis]
MLASPITFLDSYVDILLNKLEATGDLDNAIIFFTSDNDPNSEGMDTIMNSLKARVFKRL